MLDPLEISFQESPNLLKICRNHLNSSIFCERWYFFQCSDWFYGFKSKSEDREFLCLSVWALSTQNMHNRRILHEHNIRNVSLLQQLGGGSNAETHFQQRLTKQPLQETRERRHSSLTQDTVTGQHLEGELSFGADCLTVVHIVSRLDHLQATQ